MGTPTITNPLTAPLRTLSPKSLLGDTKLSHRKFTFSNSYATGGEVFDPDGTSEFEIGTVIAVLVIPPANATVQVVWDPVNKKMKAYWVGPALSGVMAEVANATNLSVTPGVLDVFIFHR